MKGHRFLIGSLAFAILMLTPQPLKALQNGSTGQLYGTVTNQNGSVLAGAIIEAKNPGTGFARRTVSDANGYFRIDLLPVGTYELKSTLAGFRIQIFRRIHVALGSSVRIDFSLATSAIEEVVVLTNDAPAVEIANPNASTLVVEEAISNLPLNGRDFSDFVLLTPGATYGDPVAVQGARGGLNIGARAIQNSFNIDGADIRSSFFGEERGGARTPFTFSQGAVQELQVIKSDYSSRFSASGAVVNAITRSGANSFRGELWTYYTHDSMVSATAGNQWQNPREPTDQTQLQYGFSLGGPITRDKLHFFASIDAQDSEIPTYVDFDRFPFGREADFESLTGLDFLIETGGQTSADAPGHIPTTNDALVFLVKLDWQLGANHLLTIRDNYSAQEGKNLASSNHNTGLTNNGFEENSFNSLVATLNTMISDTIFNQGHIQWAVEERSRGANNTYIPEAGIYANLATWGQSSHLPGNLDENRIQLFENLTLNVGNHSFNIGADLDFVGFDLGSSGYGGGSYSYNEWEGEEEGFLDGGIPYSYTQSFSEYNGALKFANNYYAAYFQDEWRATPDFTLTYGLRYEYQEHDQPKETNPLYPDTGQIPQDTDNWAPGVGFAWDINGDGKSVLRGGVGIFHDNTPTLLDANAMLNNGVRVVRYSVRCQSNPSVCPIYPGTWSSPADAGDAVRPDIFVYDPSFENPETLRMTLGYEREIVRDFSLGVSVIWQDTKKLERKWDQNLEADGGTTPDGRPTYIHGEVNGDLNQIIQFSSDAEQEYRAMILHGRKRFSNSWFLDFSYTWSSSKDHDSNERSVSLIDDFPQDQFDLSYSWGRSNFDATHKFVSFFGWQLPLNFLVSGIYTWRSGFPYSPDDYRDNNGDGYRNEYAMVEVSPGVFEQFDRNTERQPDYTTFDLRLSWTANLGKSMQLELIGEVFNLFNASNWLTSNTQYNMFDRDLEETVLDPTFGRNDLPGSPRIFQVGAKFRF